MSSFIKCNTLRIIVTLHCLLRAYCDTTLAPSRRFKPIGCRLEMKESKVISYFDVFSCVMATDYLFSLFYGGEDFFSARKQSTVDFNLTSVLTRKCKIKTTGTRRSDRGKEQLFMMVSFCIINSTGITK